MRHAFHPDEICTIVKISTNTTIIDTGTPGRVAWPVHPLSSLLASLKLTGDHYEVHPSHLSYRHVMYHKLLAAFLLSVSTATAQSAVSHITAGDKEYAAKHPAEALSQYEAAIAADPKNADALWKASRTAVVLVWCPSDFIHNHVGISHSHTTAL